MPPAEPPVPDAAALGAFADELAALGGRRPNEVEAATLFGALGISTAASTVVTESEVGEAVESSVGYPVVAKILSRDVAHKTEAGGVVLGIQDAGELASAVRTVRTRVARYRPDAVIDGVLVQRMEEGLAEVILGFRRDPEVGPVVVLGVGGILAELYKDISVRVAPVGLKDARTMIDEITGLAVLRGYRGLPHGDVDALAAAVVALSHLGAPGAPHVTEAEINPLLVRGPGEGVIAVDGLIVAGEAKR
jgi:succinyl-CoA synthetase beta subunit